MSVFAAHAGSSSARCVGQLVEPDRLHGQIFDAVCDPLVVMDAQGGVLAANAAAVRLFDLNTPAQKRRARPVRLSVNIAALGELAGRGEKIEGFPVIDRSGRATGVTFDVTPLSAPAGHALLQFRVRVESLARELWTDDAVTTVAHEFRNPLAAMRSALNLLAAGDAGALPPCQLRFIEAVQRGVGRLSRIVDGYLDLGRVRAGQLTLERNDEDVRGLLENILGDLVLCHPALGQRLGVDVAPDARDVFADRDRITQVILNLVYNAARFTPEDKRVVLRAARAGREALDDPLRVLPFDLLGEPCFTCIEVEDEGIGMSAEVLAHVFDRYREDSADAGPPAGGAHLGLHIARALVDAHDGWMRIESRLGEGTTARVFLPSDAATARLMSRLRCAEGAVQMARAARRPVTVALIEDEALRVDGDTPAHRPHACADNSERRTWVLRDGLALAVMCDDERGAAPDGACRIEDRMTFSGALRSAGKTLMEQKNNRAARAVPGLEPVRE
jgi:signal transduction histidine kinase